MKEKITVSVDAAVMRAVRQTKLNASEVCERALRISAADYIAGMVTGLRAGEHITNGVIKKVFGKK